MAGPMFPLLQCNWRLDEMVAPRLPCRACETRLFGTAMAVVLYVRDSKEFYARERL